VQAQDDLVELLQNAVHNGASVGFVCPLPREVARQYWHDVIKDVRQGSRLLLVLRIDGRVAGSVQLDLCTRPNGTHRAESSEAFRSYQRQAPGLWSGLDGGDRARGAKCQALVALPRYRVAQTRRSNVSSAWLASGGRDSRLRPKPGWASAWHDDLLQENRSMNPYYEYAIFEHSLLGVLRCILYPHFSMKRC
jgi:hypothetical protein